MSIQSNFPSIKPSLLLDFANTKKLDSRITFTRSTTATYYDGVTTAKAEENLFINSQNSTTGWTNFSNRLTITTSYEPAPDGTTTGMRLLNSSGLQGFFYQNVGNNSLVSGTTYALSVWVKSNTGVSETISLMMPETGTTTNVTATTTWSRVSWVSTLASTNSFAGLILNNGADISVWGFQLEQRSSVTAYTATTTQPITNYIPVLMTAAAGVPRFDHNPVTDESLGLLIEEQRTNLLTYSEQFDNAAWTKTNSTITANSIVAPDGNTTADSFVDVNGGTYAEIRQAPAFVSGTTYTFSVYAKIGTRRYLYMSLGTRFPAAVEAFFDLQTGVVKSKGAGATTATINAVGNGFYLCSITATANSTGNGETYLYHTNAAGDSVFYTGTGTGTVFLWGAQLEAGAFATSYIPTVASTVTRNADVASMTGTNFSSWYSAAEGTLYGEARFIGRQASVGNSRIVVISDNTLNNYISAGLRNNASANNMYAGQAVTNGTTQALLPNTPASDIGNNAVFKSVFAYAVNNFASSQNGSVADTDTSGVLPVVNRVFIGSIDGGGNFTNGTIAKIAYYPLRVTNAQLQALTS